MSHLVVLFILVCCLMSILAAPQLDTIPIVSKNFEAQSDGSFLYAYESGNGIKIQNKGDIKMVQVPKADGSGTETARALVQTGSFSYPAPDGTIIQLSYTADESGFHPEGAHLPALFVDA
ncbi:endocuticle structural glycoprotein ABD-4-like [Uranotaenia lowii]|uniref:endocuticle structural glycoprotein ABD-4-like n=1 Tax=Uranotaenia lowii TaxID=190385 RepID=UPI0024799701|nr:endocuticle structural glycoprotein ABD-4-like [Uranotaenia lowii]